MWHCHTFALFPYVYNARPVECFVTLRSTEWWSTYIKLGVIYIQQTSYAGVSFLQLKYIK